MASTPPTTLIKPTNLQQWPTDILPAILQSHGLQCQDQTRASAQHLQSKGHLNAEEFIETSPDIERTLMEAFIEDDYEGKLHLTTMSMTTCKSNPGNDSAQEDEIIGMAFWREVPSGEMNEWMDLQRISKAIAGRELVLAPESSSTIDQDHTADLSHDARNAMKLTKSDSIGWIKNALQPCQTNNGTSMMKNKMLPSKSTIQKLTHAWIKIELIAIKRTHRAHHLGQILLGCTLAKAHALHHNEHAILHVAGGGASKNIPAARLYTRYGFVSIPKHDEGGPFVKPDKDLFVLGNIGMVLNALPWREILKTGSADQLLEEDGSNGGREKADAVVTRSK